MTMTTNPVEENFIIMIHGNCLIYHNCGFDVLDAASIDNKQRSNQGFMSTINTACCSLWFMSTINTACCSLWFMSTINTACCSLWLSIETRRMSLQTDASLHLCVLMMCTKNLYNKSQQC